MNNLRKLKKIVFSAHLIIYDILTIFWCYIILRNIVYTYTNVFLSESSITIIGGADTPTTLFMMSKLFGCFFSIVFILLSIVILVVQIFLKSKKRISEKLNIILCVVLTLSLIVFMLIPIQRYAVSLFALVRTEFLIKYIILFYIILSILLFLKTLHSCSKKTNNSIKEEIL